MDTPTAKHDSAEPADAKHDDAKAPKVVVLNKSAAELLFGNVDPIGRRITSVTSC